MTLVVLASTFHPYLPLALDFRTTFCEAMNVVKAPPARRATVLAALAMVVIIINLATVSHQNHDETV